MVVSRLSFDRSLLSLTVMVPAPTDRYKNELLFSKNCQCNIYPAKSSSTTIWYSVILLEYSERRGFEEDRNIVSQLRDTCVYNGLGWGKADNNNCFKSDINDSTSKLLKLYFFKFSEISFNIIVIVFCKRHSSVARE